jgi:hypothetical protein
MSANLSIKQVKEFGVGQSGLADDAFDDVLGQVKPLVVGDRYAAGLAGMLEVDVRAGLLVNRKPAPLQSANHNARLQASEFWRHPGLDRDS